MFLSTFASMGIRRLKATSMGSNKVLCCPLLLLTPLFSSCCGENGTKEKLHFTENVLDGFLRETGGQRSKSPHFFSGKFWSEDVQSWGKGFWSYRTATRLQGERHFTSSVIYFLFFLSPWCVCVRSWWVYVGCSGVPVGIQVSVSVCISAVCTIWRCHFWIWEVTQFIFVIDFYYRDLANTVSFHYRQEPWTFHCFPKILNCTEIIPNTYPWVLLQVNNTKYPPGKPCHCCCRSPPWSTLRLMCCIYVHIKL